MKKIGTRVTALSLACLLSATAFSGCAKKETATTSGETVKLEFFQQKQEVVDVFNSLISNFEKKNPKIQIEQVNSPDAKNVLLTRVSTNDMPDMFTCTPVDTTYKNMMKQGLLLDITNEKFMSNITSQVVNLTKYNKKVYALPMATTSYGIYYNKDIFKKYNLTPPTTADELYAVCDKLKAAGVTAFAFYDKDATGIGQQFERSIGVMNNDIDGTFKNYAAGKGSADDVLKNVATMMVKLRQYGDKNTLGMDTTAATSEFTSGKAAMIISGTWLLSTIKQQSANMNVELIPLPNPMGSTVKLPVNVDPAVAISTACKHPQEAKKFLEFLSSSEAGNIYAIADASPTAINGVTSNVVQFDKIDDQVSKGNVFLTPTCYWPSNLRSDIQPKLQQLVMDKDIDKFVKDCQTIIMKDYKQS